MSGRKRGRQEREGCWQDQLCQHLGQQFHLKALHPIPLKRGQEGAEDTARGGGRRKEAQGCCAPQKTDKMHLAMGGGEADMDSRGAQASHGPAHDTMPNKERGLWAQSRNASSGCTEVSQGTSLRNQWGIGR